jgi:hypothetical protein
VKWLAVLLLPGGFLIGLVLLVRWFQSRAALEERERIQTLIALKGRHQYRYEGMDEALRERTNKRRQAAEGIRSRAAKVYAGESVSDILRLVK